MPKVTEEHRQARREQILEAALNCFARKGFHQTSMRDICKEAGLSAGAVYLHFSSKEDIIEESWKRVREVRATRFEAARQTDSTPRALVEYWSDFRKRIIKNGTDRTWQLGVQLLSEALWNTRIRESICQNWSDGEKRSAELMRHAAAQGVIRPDIDYDAMARVITAVHDGLMMMKILDPEKDLSGSMDTFEAMMVGYIMVDPDRFRRGGPGDG